MVQEYLNEIAPTLHGPNKLKTLGKPLRIADLQPPSSGQDNPATLYILEETIYLLYLGTNYKWALKDKIETSVHKCLPWVHGILYSVEGLGVEEKYGSFEEKKFQKMFKKKYGNNF